MTKIIDALQLISIIVPITERGKEEVSLRGRCARERQKIGRRKQRSTGNGPLFVDAKFNGLIVELNLSRTEARNNRLRLREWSYTLGFNCRVKCTAISRKKKKRTGVGTNVYLRNTSDYLEIALTFSYNLLCND